MELTELQKDLFLWSSVSYRRTYFYGVELQKDLFLWS